MRDAHRSKLLVAKFSGLIRGTIFSRRNLLWTGLFGRIASRSVDTATRTREQDRADEKDSHCALGHQHA